MYDPAFVKAAFSDVVRQGENSDVLEIGSKFVVLGLVDEQAEQPKTLEQVRPEITQILKTLSAKETINALANELAEALSTGNTGLAGSIISDNQLSWTDASWIKRDTNLPFNVASEAYKMSKPHNGASSYAVGNYDNYTTVLIELKSLRQTDEADASNVVALYNLEALNEWFASLLKSLRESADIKIYSDFL